jgi:replicative DNA helicase
MVAAQLEFRILSFLRNRDAYLKYTRVVKDYMFESRETKYLYKLITSYHRNVRGKQLVPLSSLFVLINSRIKPNEASKYNDVIKKIKKFKLDDYSIADDVVRRFAKRQLTRMVVMEALKSLDSEDDVNVERLRARLDEAVMVESAEMIDSGYDYFTNPNKRLEEERSEERVATLLSKELDDSMRGGLSGGKLAIVVAPTSVGKTMFLINIAYNAMKQGKKVIYITLELDGNDIAGRFDQLVSKKPYLYIERHPSVVFKAMMKLKKLGGGMRIKDCTASRLSPNDINIFLESVRKEFEFDVVLVDQIDLMYSPKEYKERRHELSSLIISLRRLGAVYNVPIWTASQATRVAGATGSTTLWDIAEDIGKANWADVILTLSQSSEDKEENVMFLDVAKNRIGEGNPRVMLETNYPLMQLKEGKEKNESK